LIFNQASTLILQNLTNKLKFLIKSKLYVLLKDGFFLISQLFSCRSSVI